MVISPPQSWQSFLAAQNAPASLLPPAAAMPNLRVRAVLTDFDGVIADNDRTMREAYAKLIAANPQENLPDVETALHYAQNPRQFFKENLTEKQELQLFMEGKHHYYQTPIYYLDGAEKTMDGYDAQSIPWAVVSNNRYSRVRWGELGLAAKHPFTPIYDSAKKPETKTLEKALEEIKQPAGRDVIMVDDEWKGLVAAADLGLTPVYFGQTPEQVVPIVKHELKQRCIPDVEIPVVRNHEELQQLVSQGIAQGTALQSARLGV